MYMDYIVFFVLVSDLMAWSYRLRRFSFKVVIEKHTGEVTPRSSE